MALYTMADLHLSTNPKTEKPMDVFGGRWDNYTEKIKKAWVSVVNDEDTVVIPGDISWCINLSDAFDDFTFIHNLPGKKIIGKGNHDLWWQSMKKMQDFVNLHGLTSISFLHNNAFPVEGKMICGSRGWWCDANADALPSETDYQKIMAREVGRLETSLSTGEKLKEKLKEENPDYTDAELLAFLHFPVFWADTLALPLLDCLKRHGVKHCYFGHIHNAYASPAVHTYDGINFHMISADFLNFVPKLVP